MIVAFLILVVVALAMYGMDYDLRCLRDGLQVEEIGAGAVTGDEVRPPSLVATLTAAGADDFRPFDWEVDLASSPCLRGYAEVRHT